MSSSSAQDPSVCLPCLNWVFGTSRRTLSIFLDKPGGQCAELYPEKPIYDIPGIPICTGQELTDRLMEQIKPGPEFHLNQVAHKLEKNAEGHWRLTTDMDTVLEAPVIVIAAGGGTFVPKKPPLPGIDAFEGTSVFYSVRKMEAFRDKDILVAGGGDLALDWAINLQPLAKKMALVHRREELRRRRRPASTRCASLADAGKLTFHIAQITELHGENGQLTGVTLKSKDQGEFQIGLRHPVAVLRSDDEAGPGFGIRHRPGE